MPTTRWASVTTTTLSRREFNQGTGHAERAASEGPVIITDRGLPAHILPTLEDDQRLAGESGGVIDLVGPPPGVEEVELEVPPPRDRLRPPDLR
jgi:hypothetical protein